MFGSDTAPAFTTRTPPRNLAARNVDEEPGGNVTVPGPPNVPVIVLSGDMVTAPVAVNVPDTMTSPAPVNDVPDAAVNEPDTFKPLPVNDAPGEAVPVPARSTVPDPVTFVTPDNP